MTPPDLQPAERDPRKLRRTAWILVAVMILGGWAILTAYNRYAERTSTSGRPAMFDKIRKEQDLRVARQDGTQAEFYDLAGTVSVVHALSATQPESAALALEVMRRLAERYADNPDVVLVSLVIDPGEPEKLTALLEDAAAQIGAELPGWWVASTDPELVRKYVKRHFKAALMPHQEDGRWIYDTSIVLVDRNRHLRRGVVPQQRGGPPFVANFDFDQAAQWDEKGIKTGTEKSNVEELEALLVKTIEALLDEPAEKP